MQLNPGDKIALVACSNALLEADHPQIEQLCAVLQGWGLVPVVSPYLYGIHPLQGGTPQQRAEALQTAYQDPDVRAIFDVSGGDAANHILEYLDTSVVRANSKPFWGYSDLTTILNALYTKTGQPGYLYQIKTLVWADGARQRQAFYDTLFGGGTALYDVEWDFLQGERIEGTVLGGNLRCLMKLAGTPYWPPLQEKVLFLESLGGGTALLSTYLYQLRQLGVFHQIKGLLLGTFTKAEQEEGTKAVCALVRGIVDDEALPIAKTQKIGHSPSSHCLPIGQSITIKRR